MHESYTRAEWSFSVPFRWLKSHPPLYLPGPYNHPLAPTPCGQIPGDTGGQVQAHCAVTSLMQNYLILLLKSDRSLYGYPGQFQGRVRPDNSAVFPECLNIHYRTTIHLDPEQDGITTNFAIFRIFLVAGGNVHHDFDLFQAVGTGQVITIAKGHLSRRDRSYSGGQGRDRGNIPAACQWDANRSSASSFPVTMETYSTSGASHSRPLNSAINWSQAGLQPGVK